ncbi:MAG: hybrid sensor histidine kinase/response regulator, partial [Sphingobacteriales bacterium]
AQENLELKVAERTRELTHKNEELELRNHELQQFSWVVSHDLKEPLRKIEMFTKLLQERYLIDDEKATDYSGRTIRASERMSKLITDLLDYSRLSSTVVPEEVSLNKLIAEIISDLDYTIEQKQALIEVCDLPSVPGVPSQLRQVFQNLIGNSLKFSKEGVTPEISIRWEQIAEKSLDAPAAQDGAYCRITVKDNGIGFDEMYLDKIFVIFQSLNDRKVYEGTGIGLAIAKKIVEKHNGLITAKSTKDQGASFIVVLPLQTTNNPL